MTDDLPRRDLPPLPPPDGAYELVSRRAAARRAGRAGVAGVLSAALVAGAFGVGASLAGTSAPDALVVASPEPVPSAVPATVPPPTYAPVPDPSPATVAPRASVAPPPPASTPTPSEPGDLESGYEGRVVDEQGRPVAGAWVVVVGTGAPQAVRVGDDGVYGGVCDTQDREYLAMWDLRGRQPRGMRNLAVTPVPPVACDEGAPSRERPVTTVLREGGTVTGTLTFSDRDGGTQPYADGAVPGGGLFCEPALPGLGTGQCADWDPVGGRYRFTGLPTGTFRLQGMYGWDDVDVEAGRTTERDWVECDGCRAGRPRASGQPSPSPSA